MMTKLSDREKKLVYLAGLMCLFLAYWYLALNPLIKKLDLAAVETGRLKAFPPAAAAARKAAVKLLPREKQLGQIIGFIEEKVRQYGLKFDSLNQTSAPGSLSLNLKFASTYYQFLAFLNSLPELNAPVVIDSVTMIPRDKKIQVEIRLLCRHL